MATVYILWLRQLKRFQRSRARRIASLAQPLLFYVAFGYGFGPVFRKAGEGDYLAFLAPGIVAMSVLFAAMFSGIELIWDRQFGFLKETLVAPVPRFHIMLGRTLGGATVAAFQGAAVLVVMLLAGFRPASWALVPAALLVALLVALLFTALATLLTDMHAFQLIMNFLIMPTFFFSGALFPLAGASPGFVIAARFDPLTYGVDALRLLLGGPARFGLGLDLAVLSVLTLLFLALGARFFARIEV